METYLISDIPEHNHPNPFTPYVPKDAGRFDICHYCTLKLAMLALRSNDKRK